MKSIGNSLVIICCIVVLGVLAYFKVDGAATSAFGTVAIVVAWLTRGPDHKDPPPLAKFIPVFAGGAALAELLSGCTPDQRGYARTALDVVQAACIIANSALPESKIADVCGITGPFLGPMKDLLAAQKAAGSADAGASPVICAMTDAGPKCYPAPAGP